MPLPNRNRRKPTDDVPVEEEPLSYLEQEAQARMFRAERYRCWLALAVCVIALVFGVLYALFMVATIIYRILEVF